MILTLALLLAQVAPPATVQIQDEGVNKGKASTLNCTGAGVTCSVTGQKATINVAGGGGGGTPGGVSGNVQVNDGAGGFGAYPGTTCAAGTYLSALDGSGAKTCGTPAGTYTLPTAAAAILGGVKVGANLAIDGAGVLSAGTSTPYVLPQATNVILGGVTAPTCAAGNHFSSVSGGGLVCTADAGGGGSANVVAITVDFGSGSDSATATVTGQAWVTGTSVIVCSPSLVAVGTRSEGDEDALIEGLEAATYSRVAGTGFSLKAWVARGRAYGQFVFHCTGA